MGACERGRGMGEGGRVHPPSARAPGVRLSCGMAVLTEGDAPLGPDPVVEAYKRDIDRTLLRENLRRSVEERVAALVALQRLAEEARRAGRRVRTGA